MNQIQLLRGVLGRDFPDHAVEIDEPDDGSKPWWLDVRGPTGRLALVVEWRPGRGFGISTPSADGSDFGTGADEVFADLGAATARVEHLLRTGEATSPPLSVQLADLRRALGMSQAELAAKAGVRQANISRIEGRADLLVNTLDRIVSAMGGTLKIVASSPGGAEQELDPAGQVIRKAPGAPPAPVSPRIAAK